MLIAKKKKKKGLSQEAYHQDFTRILDFAFPIVPEESQKEHKTLELCGLDELFNSGVKKKKTDFLKQHSIQNLPRAFIISMVIYCDTVRLLLARFYGVKSETASLL